MSLISLVIILIVVGVLLWLVNTQLASVIDGKILKIINIVVVIFVVLWLLNVLGLLSGIGDIRVGRVP
jgi:hypothetical protein